MGVAHLITSSLRATDGTLNVMHAGQQVMLGGIAHWTVGLLATAMAVACIVAADTGAYVFGKTLGRTQLISISPMKTVEGALGGMLCSCAVALGFSHFLAWPANSVVAVALGFLVRAHCRTHLSQ